MKIHWTAQFWAWSLGAALLFSAWPTGAQAEPLSTIAPATSGSAISVISPRSQKPVDPAILLKELSKANVIYLGETHDSLIDHQTQLEIIQALHRLRPKLTIGMEMFQRPYQQSLDRYLAGVLTETQLRERSQYEPRWG